VFLQEVGNVFPLEFFHGLRAGFAKGHPFGFLRGSSSVRAELKVGHSDKSFFGQSDSTLDGIHQFANIPRPMVLTKGISRLCVDDGRRFARPRKAPYVVFGKQVHIPRTVAKRRQRYAEDIQTKVKVGSELALINQFPQVAVGRGQDRYLGGEEALGAERTIGAVLQESEEFPLGQCCKPIDLIEEQRSALCQCNQSFLVLVGIGERTAYMAKQFVLEEVIRESSAINRNERTVGSWTEVMQGARTQFLSCSSFANDQNRGISTR